MKKWIILIISLCFLVVSPVLGADDKTYTDSEWEEAVIEFVPQQDITTYELAQFVEIMLKRDTSRLMKPSPLRRHIKIYKDAEEYYKSRELKEIE